MNIKIDYEDELEKIEDEHIKKMLEVTFSKILPGIISNCENENIAAKMMISLQEMLGDFSKFGIEKLQIENYFIGNTYTKYCNDLINVIDIIPADCKKQTFHIFDQVLNNTILVLIHDGLVNGSITVEELSYE